MEIAGKRQGSEVYRIVVQIDSPSLSDTEIVAQGRRHAIKIVSAINLAEKITNERIVERVGCEIQGQVLVCRFVIWKWIREP